MSERIFKRINDYSILLKIDYLYDGIFTGVQELSRISKRKIDFKSY